MAQFDLITREEHEAALQALRLEIQELKEMVKPLPDLAKMSDAKRILKYSRNTIIQMILSGQIPSAEKDERGRWGFSMRELIEISKGTTIKKAA